MLIAGCQVPLYLTRLANFPLVVQLREDLGCRTAALCIDGEIDWKCPGTPSTSWCNKFPAAGF